MRARALAGVTLIAASLALPVAPARADWPVIDISALARWGQQLKAMADALRTAQQQFQMQVAQFQSLVHITDFGRAVPGLQTPMLQSPLPGLSGDLQGALGGYGSGGNLSGLIQSNLQRNTVYQRQDGTWLDQHMMQRGRSIAGTQAAAQQLYQSAAYRIPMMQQLEQRLTTATDPKDVLDLQARLQAESSIIASQQVQAQTIQADYEAQTALVQQQVAEKRQQQIDGALQQAKAHGVNVGG